MKLITRDCHHATGKNEAVYKTFSFHANFFIYYNFLQMNVCGYHQQLGLYYIIMYNYFSHLSVSFVYIYVFFLYVDIRVFFSVC